jgi:hypothetical protein
MFFFTTSSKNWQEKVKFTFSVAKYDEVFDKLLKMAKLN